MDYATQLAEQYQSRHGGVYRCRVCSVSEFESDYELWTDEDGWLCGYCLRIKELEDETNS